MTKLEELKYIVDFYQLPTELVGNEADLYEITVFDIEANVGVALYNLALYLKDFKGIATGDNNGNVENAGGNQDTNNQPTIRYFLSNLTNSKFEDNKLWKSVNITGFNSSAHIHKTKTSSSESPTIPVEKIEFKSLHLDGYYIVGLSTNPETTTSYTDINYAVYFAKNTLYILENNKRIKSIKGIEKDSVFSFQRLDNEIYFFINDKEAYSFGKEEKNVYFDISIYTKDAGITDLKVNGNTVQPY